MKNQLTKTLLCGVMATTFFLINCQKAPSRGVKAKAGAGETAVDQKLAGKVVVDCTPSFTQAIEAARISKDKIMTNVQAAMTDKKTLSEAEKADLAKGRLEVIEKNDLVKAEMSKMTKDGKPADACKDAKDAKTTSIFEDIKNQMDKLVSDAGTLVGATDEAQTNALKARADREKKIDSRIQLNEEMELVISEKIAPLLVSANKGALYFKLGQVSQDSSAYDKDKVDKSKTTCLLNEVIEGNQTLVGLDKVKVLSVPALKLVSSRNETNFSFGKEGTVITMKCLIADSKTASYKEEIRKAFGDHLLSKSQSEAKEKAAQTQKEKNSVMEKVVATASEKETVLKLKSQAVEAAQSAIDENEKEIKVATDAKDEAKLKILNDKKSELKKTLNAATEEKEKASKEKDAADDQVRQSL